MSTKTKGLGKGLGALFTDININEIDGGKRISNLDDNANLENDVHYIDIDDIKPNSQQPRKDFNEETIQDLADSIRRHGLIQPIIITKSDFGYELVAGERRWRAARLAGLREVPALIRLFTEDQNAMIALIENVQREDLNPMEEAEALQNLAENYQLTQEELAKSIGKSRSYIANTLRLRRLPLKICDYIREGLLSAGHGKALLSLESEKDQLDASKMIIDKNLSVRETEALVASLDQSKEIENRGKRTKHAKSQAIVAVEEDLTSIMGTKVNISGTDNKGKLELYYYSLEELNNLIDILKAGN